MADADEPTSNPPPSPAPPERETPWALIAFGVLAAYAVLIVVFNREEVQISFVFFSANISKLVLILLCLGIGFATGFLFDRWRDRRRTSA
ncbi:MAG: LapA family protein [Gaiellaceae bacterium]